MATDATKIRSKLTKLNKSLDELESQLEPLLSQSLPETLLALDTIQQAKLQVVVPYVVYDLVFVYLKSRGIDPKTHRVISELDRVRQYFDKIKHAEEADQKRKLTVDKEAANRFIKHAIAQAKNAQLVDEPLNAAASSSSSSKHVPVRVTSKMIARAEYEKELKELADEEEDDLEMFDGGLAVEDEETMDATDIPLEEMKLKGSAKGKERALEDEQGTDEENSSSRHKRPHVDPFSGRSKNAELSTLVPLSADGASLASSVSASEECEGLRAAKKGKWKAKK